MEEDKKFKTKENHKGRRIVVSIISIIALLIIIVNLRGDYLEMKEIGENYLTTFWRNTILYGISFLINFLFLFFAFFLTNKEIKKEIKIFFDEEKKEIPKFPNKSVSFVIALIGSALSTKILLNKFMLCFSNSKFGIKDPIFNLDLSVFVLQKPFIKLLLLYLLIVIVATIAYALIYSIIILNKSLDGVSRETLSKVNVLGRLKSRIYLIAILLGLFVIVFMVLNIGNEKFMGIELKDGLSYSLYGAGHTDATIKLVGFIILAFLVMYSVFRAYKALVEKSVRKFISTILIVPVYFIALALVLALYSMIFMDSNKLSFNEKYIKDNIQYTKQAYGININENTIDYSGTISQDDIKNNSNLINNINIVGSENVLQDLENSKDSKGFYSYRNTQIEQYNIDGIDTAVYITPREISNTNTSYSSKTYEYTHGYGIVATLAGKTDENGNLKVVQDQFGDLSNAKIKISQPRIYFGLENNSAVVINSNKKEIDYVENDSTNSEAITYNYDGPAGLYLNFFDRLILGIKENDIKLATSTNIKNDSKIITNRNVINRAKAVMPYLEYDENPYLVVDDNQNQYWVIDAYTTSNEYPFSQKTTLNGIKEINYLRNSAKVIVNAYTGELKFYITDRQDPIIMAYNNIFKDLFAKEDDTIPEDISKHFIYPKALYNIQSNIVSEYHNIEPEVFYRGNDIWEVAKTQTSGKEYTIKPYYTMIKNSDGTHTVGLVLPYSDYGKQNLRSYLIGTYVNGKAQLSLTRFSSDSAVLGPIQLETQINQDEKIATEIASLNTTGTKITKNLIAVPVNKTMLYVETIYQQFINETTQKPTLKRVVVASGSKVAIGNDIESAIENLLSKNAIDLNVADDENIDDLVEAIIKANDNVKNSSKAGDWKLYGEDMQTLTTLIDQLNTAKQLKDKEALEQQTNEVDSSNEVVNSNTVANN